MILQPIIDIAEICARKGLQEVVISPGSRSAPLTLAFARHPDFRKHVIADERSAGFIALGLAQYSKKPVAMVCTSGTAVYNFAPAVAEAFYQQVPLVVLTADRPPEWIDQWDGQTLRQDGVFGSHVKAAYQLPLDYQHPDSVWHIYRIINEAVNMAQVFPPGPVHINVPLREPFYPTENESWEYSTHLPIIEEWTASAQFNAEQWLKLDQSWSSYPNKLIVIGQHDMDLGLQKQVVEFARKHQIPVVAEILSNAQTNPGFIQYADVFLGANQVEWSALKPDLLLSFGQSIISKNLKVWLRKIKPLAHWHIQEAGYVPDVFQGLQKLIRLKATDFFETGMEKLSVSHSINQYSSIWKQADSKVPEFWNTFFHQTPFGEFKAYSSVMNALPACNLHLANSMAVRYANLMGVKQQAIRVFANRGTSGIDGSTSTAIGSAIASNELTVLLTGDMAFLYDKNAFWNNLDLRNLRVVVMNNHAGGIFGLIDGPARQPELQEYFETEQHQTAEATAKEAGAEYYFCTNEEQVLNHLEHFFQAGSRPKILEIGTDITLNKSVFKQYKSKINQQYGA